MPLVGLHTTSREGGREEESRSVVTAVTSLACEQVRVKQELEAVVQHNQEVCKHHVARYSESVCLL